MAAIRAKRDPVAHRREILDECVGRFLARLAAIRLVRECRVQSVFQMSSQDSRSASNTRGTLGEPVDLHPERIGMADDRQGIPGRAEEEPRVAVDVGNEFDFIGLQAAREPDESNRAGPLVAGERREDFSLRVQGEGCIAAPE